MSVAKTIEISSKSKKSFEDAIHQAISRVTKTVDNVRSAWIKDQEVVIEKNKIAEYRVRLQVTFELKG